MRTLKKMDAVLFDADALRQEARACTRLAHMQVLNAKRDALLAIRRDCLRLVNYLEQHDAGAAASKTASHRAA